MIDSSYYSCQVVCYAEAFDFTALTENLLASGRGARYRNVFYVELEQGSHAIFPFGVAVYWNLGNAVIDQLAQEICRFAIAPLMTKQVDHFSYIDGCDKNRFSSDHIQLIDTEQMTLLAISHALAQSTKLSVLELQAKNTLEDTAAIPRKLAETGSTSLSRKQAAMMRGQLFVTKSEILLKYELLDTPEFIWEYPELQATYEIGATYLELKQRTEFLSLKLETIHELFEMLSDDLKHQHSSKLEWIIIWLIAVEIVIFIINDIILGN